MLAVLPPGPSYRDDLKGTELEEDGEIVDYLQKYTTERGFDGPQLLHDDHFKAIKVLVNAGHYVSAGKLLVSFIDTVAFIEFGDSQGNFSRWLDTYVDLTRLGITSQELWEFRNGLLHMTSLDSRAVRNGKVARLIQYVGDVPESARPNTATQKYFNLKNLIIAMATGLPRWFDTYNHQPDKRIDFVMRYDLTVSDARPAPLT